MAIIQPSMRDIFIKRKGELLCQAKVLKPSLTRIWWEDENGNTLVTKNPVKNGKSMETLPLDITYDEWSQGITRYCFVEHSEWLEPLKERYERHSGKDVSMTIVPQCHCKV